MTLFPEQQQAPGAGVWPGLQGIKQVTPTQAWNKQNKLHFFSHLKGLGKRNTIQLFGQK
jgi:hypothetical protein